MFMIATLLFLSRVVSPAASKIVLDGGSAYPARQSVTCRWACPEGLVTIEIAQSKGSYPVIERATYGTRSVIERAGKAIGSAIRTFRTVESISPRCIAGGGISLIFAGLSRGEVPATRHVVAVKLSRSGHVSME